MPTRQIKQTKTIVLFALYLLITNSAFGEDLPEFQNVGYRVVHHLGVQIDHMERIGFNTFEHPRIADYHSFVITPALDHCLFPLLCPDPTLF